MPYTVILSLAHGDGLGGEGGGGELIPVVFFVPKLLNSPGVKIKALLILPQF